MNKACTPSRLGVTLVVALVVAMMAGSACALQPGQGGPPPRDGERGPGGPDGPRGPGQMEGGPRDAPGMFEPGALRARLERRLEDLKKEQSRLQEALDRLAKGEKPKDVGREMVGGRREGRPEGRGEGRPDGGPDGRTDRRGDGPRDIRGEGGPGEGSPEDREHLLALLREAMPGLAAKAEANMKDHPDAVRRMMARWEPRLREIAQLRRHDPELFALRVAELREGWSVIEATRAARELVKSQHDADADIASTRKKAKEALREALARKFDARLAMQSHEVKALSKRLDELKARLDEQKGARESRIKDASERIMSDKDLPLEREPRD